MTSDRATAVAALGPVAVGSMVWRHRGQRHLTAIVKAQFAMRPDHVMETLDAPHIVTRDVYEDDDPTRSLAEASDVVPFRPRADIWLRGHAQTPGPPVSVLLARLALYRGGRALLDKVLQIVGDRVHPDAVPQPFARMPLVYERAFGGIDHEDNPVGRAEDGNAEAPNLLAPQRAGVTACFAPISPYWKVRRRHRGEAPRYDGHTLMLAEDTDWAFFQAAPPDQQVPYLQGGEWIVLDGVDATTVRLQSRLPKLSAEVRLLRGGDDEGDRLAVVADGLAIDTDARVCTVTWRGNVPVAAEDEPSSWVLAAALVPPGTRVAWAQARRAAVPVDAHPSAATSTAFDATTHGAADDTLGKTTVDPITTPAPPSHDGGLPTATEPGRPPPFHEEDLPWIHEEAQEPPAVLDDPYAVTAPFPRSGAVGVASEEVPEPAPTQQSWRPSTMPPAPLDVDAYLAGLRRAGATDEDVEALLPELHRAPDD
ncbi:MAG: DUF2169 domain-containing protein [Myxococcota bacterium]